MKRHYHVIYPNNGDPEISNGVHRNLEGAHRRMIAEAEALRQHWGYSYDWSLAVPESIIIGKQDEFGIEINRMEVVSCDMPFAHCATHIPA